MATSKHLNLSDRIAIEQGIYQGLTKAEIARRLVESRRGLNLSQTELDNLAKVVCALIKKGQSPYAIVTNHPDLGLSVKTLYNYVAAGLLRPWGVIDLDLRLKVRRPLKKRADRQYLNGRTYDDFLALLQ